VEPFEILTAFRDRTEVLGAVDAAALVFSVLVMANGNLLTSVGGRELVVAIPPGEFSWMTSPSTWSGLRRSAARR
jgi:hypothetical protein